MVPEIKQQQLQWLVQDWVFTYMPCSKVGGVHHHSAVQLLQDRIWEDCTATGAQEALTLNLSQQQHQCWVFWRNIQHLGRSKQRMKNTAIKGRDTYVREHVEVCVCVHFLLVCKGPLPAPAVPPARDQWLPVGAPTLPETGLEGALCPQHYALENRKCQIKHTQLKHLKHTLQWTHLSQKSLTWGFAPVPVCQEQNQTDNRKCFQCGRQPSILPKLLDHLKVERGGDFTGMLNLHRTLLELSHAKYLILCEET